MPIQCIHISKKYDNQVVLNDVSVTFEDRKIHGLVGRNGSGKTMLMKCICGYVRPDSGHVLINDQQIGSDIEFPPSMGLMLETPGFLPQFSGRFNLSMLYAIRNKPDRQIIRKAIETVGLDPDSKKKVGHYSLGMRQRLGIAQALMESPDLLILDEPFNGLDETGVHDIRVLLSQLRDEGKTIILSSHYAQDIDMLCDTVHEMKSGSIQEK
ncbi:MAG: ABC transporter ATP-binding protein [Clostridia bacterium]|nr:ABC transporter ATP-binding protein [Clostridia bacterium]